MSMSTHVCGIRPPDEKWKKMKAAFDSCQNAGIEVPDEVWDFFGGERPDEAGVIVALPTDCATEWRAEMQDGYEVDISKLPKDVTVIRFAMGTGGGCWASKLG